MNTFVLSVFYASALTRQPTRTLRDEAAQRR